MAIIIRANDVKASNLYFLSSLLSLIGAFLHNRSVLIADIQTRSMLAGMLLFMAVLMLSIGIGIRRGYGLAKIVFLLLYALAILSYVDGLPYSNNLLRGLLELVTNLIDTGVAVIIIRDLLHQPATGEAAGRGSLPPY